MCLQDSDDSACHPGTGVSGGQAVGESSTAHVVGVGVHDHGATKDVVGTDQRDERVRERELRHPRVVRLDVAQVTGVSGFVIGTAVFVLRKKKNDEYISVTYQFNGVVVFMIGYEFYHSRVQMMLQ